MTSASINKPSSKFDFGWHGRPQPVGRQRDHGAALARNLLVLGESVQRQVVVPPAVGLTESDALVLANQPAHL